MTDLFFCHINTVATYDVQDAKICGEGGNIFIKCVFASGSQAKGCHAEIGNASIPQSDFSTNIVRRGNPQSHTADKTVTGLTPGNYNVFIFDWERDGSVASRPSFVGNATVTGILIINTSEVGNSSVPSMTTTVTGPDPSPTTGRRTMVVAILQNGQKYLG